MEDGVFSSTTGDFDFMDELLLSGCWLETTDGSNSLESAPSGSPAPPYDFLNSLTPSELRNESSNIKEERERSFFYGNPPLLEQRIDNPIGAQTQDLNTIEIAEFSGQLESHMAEGSFAPGRRLWIGPGENPGSVSSVRERLVKAIQYIKESTKEREVLIQIWVPTQREGKHVLTTNDQPFSFDPNNQRLASYRNVSEHYQFPAEEDSKESIGLPGRVFLQKLPEWTPDVRFFSKDEYPRIGYAQHFDVRGTLALPVFERGSRTCLGVVEVVMTTQKTSYLPDLELVCKALEAVDFRSSEVSSSSNVKVFNESYQTAIPEILEVLRAICETHKLPLAQTWVPCIQQGKKGCRHSDETITYCVSTVDSACYVTDPQIWGFHQACSEHHLFRGQGIVGRAFMTNQPCFSDNITALSKTDYPLSHHARIFGLRAAVAIRLRSIYTVMADYVLEFFLPEDCKETQDQKMLLNSLSLIIQRICRTLRVVTDKELEEENVLRIGDTEIPSDGQLNREEIPMSGFTPPKGSSREESSWNVDIRSTHQKGKSVSLEFQKEESAKEFKVTTPRDNSMGLLRGSSVIGESKFTGAGKMGEKRRTKTEKSISLQVLRQYFAGSLKDAAKNIGVCPTTLKRICRQHGITRWPSRKIKKVGHSLRKLQVVIDSVQGAEGTFQIESFYENFPDLASPNVSGSNPFSKLNVTDDPKLENIQTEAIISSEAAPSKSPSSSCSQSSSSSPSCSNWTLQNPHEASVAVKHDFSLAENLSGGLQRAHSDAELLALSREAPRLPERSLSHKSLGENPSLESLPPLPKNKKRSHISRNKDSLKVKVTFGEEKIRFRVPPNCKFEDLKQEIAKRFNIDDENRINMKYLDDDSEWVLLTCDADLEECKDIYKLFQMNTIKLSVQVSQPKLRHSSGSTHPS